MSFSYGLWCKEEWANVILAALLSIVVVDFPVMGAVYTVDRHISFPSHYDLEWKRGRKQELALLNIFRCITWHESTTADWSQSRTWLNLNLSTFRGCRLVCFAAEKKENDFLHVLFELHIKLARFQIKIRHIYTFEVPVLRRGRHDNIYYHQKPTLV